MSTPHQKIPVAVSACLLGRKVRYDGKDKRHLRLVELLQAASLSAVEICPEVAIGLGVPRAPLALMIGAEGVRVKGLEDRERDVTDPLARYAMQVATREPRLCGMICKSRSPSCGLAVALRDPTGRVLPRKVQGRFVHGLLNRLPGLPVIEEKVLDDEDGWRAFVSAVKEFACRRGMSSDRVWRPDRANGRIDR